MTISCARCYAEHRGVAQLSVAPRDKAERQMTRLTIRIDFEDGRQIGHGKIRLLELIAQTGSISQAAREMGMSYRRAWLLADEMNRMFVNPLIETQPGGSGGGFARLTSLGHAVVGHYRSIEAQTVKQFAKQLSELESGLSA